MSSAQAIQPILPAQEVHGPAVGDHDARARGERFAKALDGARAAMIDCRPITCRNCRKLHHCVPPPLTPPRATWRSGQVVCSEGLLRATGPVGPGRPGGLPTGSKSCPTAGATDELDAVHYCLPAVPFDGAEHLELQRRMAGGPRT